VSQHIVGLGKPADAARYASIKTQILATLRSRLYNSTTGSFADGLDGATASTLAPVDHISMQATLFPMMAGVVNESEHPGMGKAMVRFLNTTGMKCSCMAGFWLLEGLYQVGLHTAEAADHALAVMVSDGQYSWLNMIAQGATCTMETWPSGTAADSGGTGGTWSHPWCTVLSSP
jgi:hypothetical protein